MSRLIAGSWLLNVIRSLTVLSLLVETAMVNGAGPLERASLTGITEMNVIVENFSPKAIGLGLDRDVLKSSTELRLRRSGVKVSDSAIQYIYINVNLVPVFDGTYVVYNAEVTFIQKAQLLANQKVHSVTTWSTGQTGGVGKQNVRDIRHVIDDLIDAFINDYLAANQK